MSIDIGLAQDLTAILDRPGTSVFIERSSHAILEGCVAASAAKWSGYRPFQRVRPGLDESSCGCGTGTQRAGRDWRIEG
jgi:hypothetical protein